MVHGALALLGETLNAVINLVEDIPVIGNWLKATSGIGRNGTLLSNRQRLGAIAGFAAESVPFEGFASWGRDVVGWGKRAEGAIARTAEITAQEARGLDPSRVRAARTFYQTAAEAGRGGQTAVERAKLMDRIIELQSRAP